MDRSAKRNAGDAGVHGGSRRARKKERTRREIFDAAMALFGERGFGAVTIEEICARADVARATFFLHYPTKAALLFEYARALAGELESELGDEDETAAEQFGHLARGLVRSWSEREAVMREMLRELFADPDVLRSARTRAHELPALVAGVVKRGQERGEFRPDVAPHVAAAAFLSSSLALLAASRRPARLRDELVDLTLYGLVAGAGPEATR